MDKDSYLIDFKEYILNNEDLSPKLIQIVRNFIEKLQKTMNQILT